MARKLSVPGFVVLAALALAPGASAELRSPHVDTSCPAGYTYGEHVVRKWRVEGCAKAGTASGNVEEKWLFDGTVEANGMLIEIASGSADIVVTDEEIDEGSRTTFVSRIKRSESTRLVLDPKIGNTRRKTTIYTGSIDLEAVDDVALVTRTLPVGGIHLWGAKARAAGAFDGGTVDIPVSGTPSLLGMRLQDDIDGAELTDDSISFKPAVSLGSAAPNLIDDFTNTNAMTVELEDGDGMKVTDIVFKIRDIAIEGIGGLEDFRVEYDAGDDSWSGGVELDMGSLFPTLEFETEVSASNGSIQYIRAKVDNLNIPIGATGITLNAVEAAFGLQPLFVQAGVGVSAGPRIAGRAVIDVSGSLRIELEPSFRLEASGTVRLLPSGNGELARGNAEFIYDADGYIAMSGDAHFEVTALGVGIGADIGGSGEYSTTNDHFNIEAHATGRLILGFLGDVDVVRLEAVVSSNGWAACGEVLPPFISAGIGQDWDRGVELLLGCDDMSDFDANVPGARAAQARLRAFRVPEGTTKLGVAVTTDQPGKRVRFATPDGNVRLVTEPGMRGQVDPTAAVVSRADKNQLYAVFMNPPAGRWAVQVEPGAQITDVRVLRNAPPLQAVARTVRRRNAMGIQVRRTSALGPGEALQVGVRSRRGLRPVGEPSAAAAFEVANPELGDTGTHEIVARVVRNGIPLGAKRGAVIGKYTVRHPRPQSLRVRQRRGRITVTAIAKRKARRAQGGVTAEDDWETPVALWSYTFRGPRGGKMSFRPGAGKPVTVAVGRRVRRFVVEVRPIVRGRILRGAVYRKTVRVQRRVR